MREHRRYPRELLREGERFGLCNVYLYTIRIRTLYSYRTRTVRMLYALVDHEDTLTHEPHGD